MPPRKLYGLQIPHCNGTLLGGFQTCKNQVAQNASGIRVADAADEFPMSRMEESNLRLRLRRPCAGSRAPRPPRVSVPPRQESPRWKTEPALRSAARCCDSARDPCPPG